MTGRTVKILPELRSEWLYDLVKTQNAGALGSAEAEFQLFNLNTNAARHLLRSHFFLRARSGSALSRISCSPVSAGWRAEILVRAARCNFAIPGAETVAPPCWTSAAPPAIAAAEARLFRHPRDRRYRISRLANSPPTIRPGRTPRSRHSSASPPLAVIVALRHDDVALNTAMRFRKLLDELGLFATPVFVRIREQHRLGAFLSQLEAQSLFRDRLTPFGSLAYLTSPAALLDQSLDILARAAHEVWLRGNAQSDSPAAVPWEKLAEFHKQANRALADYIPVRLRCCGLRLVNGRRPPIALDGAQVEKLAALEHWRWCVELRSLGWRYAETRDDFLKLHNRLVDWAELPEGTKDYNREMARHAAADRGCRRHEPSCATVSCSPTRLGDEPLAAAEPGTQLVIAADPARSQGLAPGPGGARRKARKCGPCCAPALSPQLLQAASWLRSAESKCSPARRNGRRCGNSRPPREAPARRWRARRARAWPFASALSAIGRTGCQPITTGLTGLRQTLHAILRDVREASAATAASAPERLLLPAEAPMLRAISPLAEGSDRIFAAGSAGAGL